MLPASKAFGRPGPRERGFAIAGAVVVQAGLALALLNGLRVSVAAPAEAVSHLIEFALPTPPVRPKPLPRPAKAQPKRAPAAPAPRAPNPGGSHGAAHNGSTAMARTAAIPAPALPAGGGRGTGASIGTGSGGGAGAEGTGEDEGGTDLYPVSGEILPQDYPKQLGNAGIGGTVGMVLTVGTDGRVSRCRVTRSSGIPQLDSLTCRLIEERFRFHPSTDRYGRPIEDETDWDQTWEAPR